MPGKKGSEAGSNKVYEAYKEIRKEVPLPTRRQRSEVDPRLDRRRVKLDLRDYEDVHDEEEAYY